MMAMFMSSPLVAAVPGGCSPHGRSHTAGVAAGVAAAHSGSEPPALPYGMVGAWPSAIGGTVACTSDGPVGRTPVVNEPARICPVSYTHLRAHETGRNLVCRLLL